MHDRRNPRANHSFLPKHQEQIKLKNCLDLMKRLVIDVIQQTHHHNMQLLIHHVLGYTEY